MRALLSVYDKTGIVELSRELRGLGWAPEVAFADGLRATVEWYRTNEAWWRAIQAGSDYADYVAANYGGRAGA